MCMRLVAISILLHVWNREYLGVFACGHWPSVFYCLSEVSWSILHVKAISINIFYCLSEVSWSILHFCRAAITILLPVWNREYLGVFCMSAARAAISWDLPRTQCQLPSGRGRSCRHKTRKCWAAAASEGWNQPQRVQKCEGASLQWVTDKWQLVITLAITQRSMCLHMAFKVYMGAGARR